MAPLERQPPTRGSESAPSGPVRVWAADRLSRGRASTGPQSSKIPGHHRVRTIPTTDAARCRSAALSWRVCPTVVVTAFAHDHHHVGERCRGGPVVHREDEGTSRNTTSTVARDAATDLGDPNHDLGRVAAE